MSLTAAEKKVRKLARLESNSQCANCGTIKRLGYSTVCIKFHTFVCNNCKSSHQAISHRCKSLTMSSWTDAEVAELERKGNDYCRRTWLKNAPPPGSGGRPKEGDHVDVFKRFVVDVYERKKYFGEDDGPAPSSQGVSTAIPITQAPAPRSAASRQMPPVRAAVAPPVAAAPAPMADLLDFSSAAPAPSFQANFDAFQAAPAAANFANFDANPAPAAPSGFGFIQPPPAAAPVPASSSTKSGFGFIQPPPAAAPAAPAASSSAFGFISSPPAAAVAAPAPAASNDFADFTSSNTTLAPTQTPDPVKKPVMGGSSQKSSLISSMSMPAPSGGRSNNMNPMMMGNPQMMNQMNPQMMNQMNPQMMNQMNPQMMNQMNPQMMGMMNGGSMMMGNPQMMNPQMMGMNPQMMGMNSNNMMMNNNNMGMMGMQNNNMMGMNNFGGGGFGGQNQQQQQQSMNDKNSMNSLDFNMSSMAAWSAGKK